MAQVDKLIERMKRRPPDMDFSDVRRVLESRGFTGSAQGSSHVVFRDDGRHISIPLVGGRRVRRVYLDQIIDLLGL
jgi:predicted RNA binding protein YcfA (HicA-like mRNA interferase family)